MIPTPTPFRIELAARTIPRVLAVVVACLLVIHLGFQTLVHRGVDLPWDLHMLWNVDEEPTVPTWYSSVALAFATLLLRIIAGAEKRAGGRDAGYWLGLTIGFGILSLDEVAALHELANTFMPIEWTIPGAFVALGVGAIYIPFLGRLPAAFRNRFLIAGAVFLSGALVVEHLTGPDYFKYSMESMPYVLMSSLEEGLEMYGVVLWIRALLLYMEERARLAPGTVVPVDVGVSGS
jgi:hypothetical protein